MTPDTLAINLKPNPELSSQTIDLLRLVEGLTVTTAEESLHASGLLMRLQKMRRWVSGIYKDAKAPLTTAKRTLDLQEHALIDPLTKSEQHLQRMIAEFQTAQEQRRQQLHQEAQAAAQVVALAQQAAHAAQLRAAAEAQSDTRAAEALTEQAHRIEDAPILMVPVAPVVMDASLADGMHARTTYGAEVENLRDLVLAVAAQIMVTECRLTKPMRRFLTDQFLPTTQCSLQLLTPAMPELNRLARALRTDLSIPGVTITKHASLVSRA